MEIVIADDSVVSRNHLKEILKALNHDVVAEVVDGRDAIEAVQKHQPDLVIMDLEMPVMDGIEATGRIKREFPEIPVVVLTSVAQKKELLKATQRGADATLTKPANESELIQILIQFS